MIVLKILGIVFLIICVLLFCPIIIKIENKNKDTDFKVKFLFFTFKNIGKKNKKEKHKKISTKKKKQKDKDKPLKEEEKKDKISKSKLVKLVLNAINSGNKAFIKLVKGVKIYDIEVFFVVASTDAYETALKFAKVQGAYHTIVAILRNAIKIDLNKVIIQPNFVNEDEIYDYSLKVKIKPITIILSILYFIFKFGIKYLKDNKEKDNKKEKQNN